MWGRMTYHVVVDKCACTALRHLRPVCVEENWDVSELRRLEGEAGVQVEMEWEGGKPFLCATTGQPREAKEV